MSIFKKPEKKPQTKLREFRDGVIGLVALVVLGAIGWNALIGSKDESSSAEATVVEVQLTPDEIAAREAEEAARAAEKAKELQHGFHCLSGWDGSHRDFVQAVKVQLNDPDSFDHDSTKTWPVNEAGLNVIVMDFRAKNGFGGTIRGKAVGSFDNTTCAPVLDFIE